jgi:L-threonylcarbamoyladenylate synthase
VVFKVVAKKLAKKFWPGPLTLILPTTPLGKLISGGRGDLGVRIPDCPPLRKILNKIDFPLFSTSANPSGRPPAKSPAEAVKYFRGKMATIITVASRASGLPSTVVDVSVYPYRIIREGEIDKKMLERFLKVC